MLSEFWVWHINVETSQTPLRPHTLPKSIRIFRDVRKTEALRVGKWKKNYRNVAERYITFAGNKSPETKEKQKEPYNMSAAETRIPTGYWNGQVGRWVSGSVYMTVRLYGYMAVWHNGRQQKSWRVPATSSLNKLFIRNVCRTKMATDASSNFFTFSHTHKQSYTHRRTSTPGRTFVGGIFIGSLFYLPTTVEWKRIGLKYLCANVCICMGTSVGIWVRRSGVNCCSAVKWTPL